MQPSSRPPSRTRRWLVRIGWGLLAFYALYLVAGNVFLNSRLGREAVNRKPEKFRMDWAGGHTLWPGRVALRDVRMQGHVRRTQWSVEADAARGRIALWPLLAKEVRIPWVEADAVSGTVDRVAADMLPPEHRPGGWTLRMDRIASDSIAGGTVWGWRIAGQGQAEVGFSKQFRGGPAELFPSSATFRQTTVARDGQDWLRGVDLSSTFSLARHLSSEYPGLAKLDLFAATLKLQAETIALRSRLDEAGRYHFDAVPGEGKVEADLALARGALAPGGRLSLQVPLHAIDAQGARRDNILDAILEAGRDLHLQARVPQREGHLIALEADLRLPGNALPLSPQDWRQRLTQATGSARGQWHVPSIGGLLALFTHADWLGLEGSGTVEADLQLRDGRLAEGSTLRARDVVATANVLGNVFRGRARADAVIEAGDGGEPRSKVDLAMDSFGAAPARTPSRPYVTGNDLRLSLVSDARLERMRETTQARLRFNGARIPDLTVFNPYLPNDRLRFRGGSGRLDGDLRVDADGDVGEGRLKVDARQARLAVAGIDLSGDVSIDGRLRRGNLQRGDFDLGGTRVQLRNVGFAERGGTPRSGWWATVDLDGGRVAWKHPPSAGGRIRAQMKDVGFLLALFADHADYPAWIGRVIDAGEARLDGRWSWHGDTLILDRARAANDRFSVDARLRLQGQDTRGDLYASWRRLGVGVELQDARRRFHLRNAREWYDARPDLIR